LDNIYEDVAIIFYRHYDIKKNNVVLKPIKVIKGEMKEEFDCFIDKDNYSYVHYQNIVPGNVFGLRCNIKELMEYFDVSSENEAIEKYFEFVSQYDYQVVIDKERNCGGLLFVNKGSQEKRIFYDRDFMDVFEIEEEVNIDINSLETQVKEKIKGQDKAIEKFVTSLWLNYQTDNKNNIILAGPTGVGKTAIVREVAKILDIPVYRTSIVGKSGAGYVGGSIEDIFQGLLAAYNYDINKVRNAIIILDEFDKISMNKGGQVATESIQNELLTLLEDGEVLVNVNQGNIITRVLLPTKDMTFIGLGNFYGIMNNKGSRPIGFGNNVDLEKNSKVLKKQDLIQNGFIPDLVGRMPIIINLETLTEEVLIEILKSEHGILRDRINILENNGVSIDFLDTAYLKMAQVADKETGARALNEVVNNTLSGIIYEVSKGINNYNRVIVTEETVDNPKKFIKKK
jgi:ATP-dependent Clp protease ATP-binding subunit ClpX